MRRSMWWMAALVAVLGMTAVAAAAPEGDDPPGDLSWGAGQHGQGPGFGRGMGRELGRRGGGFGARLLERLDLTQQQRDQLAALRDQEQRKAIETRAQLEVARLDLRKLMRAEKADRTAIDAQIDRLATLRAQLQKDRVGMMLDTRALLTAEQRKKLEELRREGPRQRQGRMAPGQGAQRRGR
jgi:Spy/CpxP family protein refolding chaperone